MKKNILIACFLIFSILLLASCSNDKAADDSEKDETKTEKEDEKSDSDLGDYNIDLSGEVIEDDKLFIIEGKSNLIAGSRLVGEVVVESEDENEEVFSDTTELVEDDGSFYMELDHHKYGEAEIIIRFDFDNVQEDEVKRHYGEKGQKLEGPFIYKHETYDGILKKAEAKIAYDPNETNDLVIKANDWYDLPEDYGDPRVWIEFDDIKEDGEYFYLHGTSNILEGSEMEAKYKNNHDKTEVNPDGSFDFKIDYEYLEDSDFVITFKPAGYQWNEIEENYGATGKKLIGNLVVSDKYNADKQYIEKIIPCDNQSASDSKQDQRDADDDGESKEENDKDTNEEEDKD